VDRASASGAEERSSSLRGGAGQDRRKAVFVLHYNSSVNQKYLFVVLLAVFCAGCGIQVDINETETPTAPVITSTLPPTLTPRPSETPLPPPPSPTVTPVEGIASTQVNVRAEPSTAGEALGIIAANTRVEIVGRDPGGNWWQIIYPTGVDGKGWVTAQFITTAIQPEVPVIEGEEMNPNSVGDAVVIQQLNVRSGPGTGFNSLGILNANDVVNLTGKNGNGTWLQIEFDDGPNGKGWVNAGFVRAENAEDLPILTDEGVIVGTGTPADTPLHFDGAQREPPTPTVVPAPNDNDSAQAPAVNIVFSTNGTRAFQYSSDISSPTGDSDDWIQFKTYTETVHIEMTCLGNGQLNAEFLLGNQFEADWGNGPCGGSKVISIRPNTTYLLHIQIAASTTLTYVQYTLKIRSIP
jgi:uncharacterized protein YraI